MLTFELPSTLYCLLNTAKHCSMKPKTFYFIIVEDESYKPRSCVQYLPSKNVRVKTLTLLGKKSIIIKGNLVFSNVKYRET